VSKGCIEHHKNKNMYKCIYLWSWIQGTKIWSNFSSVDYYPS